MPVPGRGVLADIGAALAPSGLIVRGGFAFSADEDAPAGTQGKRAQSVVLAGHGGGALWAPFSAWRERQPVGLADPLDTWSKQVLGAVAERFGARAVFPSDPPYLPFQQWAMRAEGLLPSPLGILMHPDFGLWHAYRGALLFDEAIAFPPVQSAGHPCHACEARPCLTACPVHAHGGGGFDVHACRAHVRAPDGEACRTGGCLARNACPVGAAYRYPAGQQRFHQAAFAGG